MRSLLTSLTSPCRPTKVCLAALLLMVGMAHSLTARNVVIEDPFSLENTYHYGYDIYSNLEQADFECNSKLTVELSDNESSYRVLLRELLKEDPSDSEDFQYYIIGQGGKTFSCSHVGRTMRVQVKQLSTQQKCVVWVTIRDRGIPQISNCGTPVTVGCQDDIDNIGRFGLTFSDNCTPSDKLNVTYKDKTVDVADCTILGASSKIERTWTVYDRYGNSNSCVQTIFISRPPMSAVKLPGTVTLDCTNANTSPSNTGVPTLNGKPFDHLCGVIVDYKDQVSQECGKTLVIWRKWRLTDCCTWVVKEHVQKIRVVDTSAPVVVAPDDITLGTNRNSMNKWYTIPFPEVTEDCDDNPRIKVTIDGRVTLDPGKLVELAKGEHIINYMATDNCGNVGMDEYKVTIEDQDPPVLGCTDITVMVDFDSLLILCVEDLDNVLATDNCGDVDLMIRKGVDNCDDGEDDLLFDDCVAFCCDDGSSVYVTVKATDDAGNMSTCRFKVTVGGPIGDLTLEIDSFKTINCDQPIRFDEPEVTAVCATEIIIICDTLTNTIDTICGLGTITKRFIATNALNGDMDTAIQTITVVNPNPFTADNFICPASRTVTGCTIADAGDLEDLTFVDLGDLACFSIDTVSDITITSDDSTCIVITRTWRISDICQPDTSWTCEQIIRIVDDEAPTLSGASDETFQTTDTTCSARVLVGPVSASDCDTSIDVTNNFGGGNVLDSVLDVGVYRVEFYATDNCGNSDTLAVVITVEDNVNPEIFCEDIVINCGETVPSTEPRATDNCGVDSVRLIAENTSSLDACGQGTITRTYEATDESGNTAQCEVTITINGNGLFTEANIVFPRSPIVINDCVDPTSVDGGTTTVDTAGIPCIDVSVFSSDSIGSSAEFCYVIYRTWTVIDSCNFDPLTGMGIYDSVQVIAINDTLAPVLSGPADVTVNAGPNCTAQVELDSVTAMDCDPNVVIVNSKGGGAQFSGAISVGVDTITFTATDSCGNESSLDVIVTVLDTIPPTITCRDDLTVDCGTNYEFELPTIFDVCSPNGRVMVDSVRLAADCGRDTVVYSFTATDGVDNRATCSYRVIFEPAPLDCSIFTLMMDTIELESCESPTSPDSIFNSRPVIPDLGTCYALKIFFEDETSSNGAGAGCDIIITRTWSIVDTCGPAPYDTCKLEQVLRLTDDDAPQLLAPADTCHFAAVTDTNRSLITLPPAIARDCDPDVQITNDFNDQGARISDFFPLGATVITFIATDACGNSDTAQTVVEVKDDIGPSFACAKQFRHVSDDMDPRVFITADEFVSDIFDNFSDSTAIRFSFSTDVFDTLRTYGCDSLGTLPVTVYGTDESGNQDSCQVLVRILDTLGFCPDTNALLVNVAGNVGTRSGRMISDVTLNSEMQSSLSAFTDEAGFFRFNNIGLGTSFDVIPSKKVTNRFDGITSQDLLLMQKHILDVGKLQSPYDIIAADVNMSGDVTTLDVALLQLAMLGRDMQDAELGWRFVDKSFKFTDPSNPWLDSFPESIMYDPLMSDQMKTDFVAIKLGDVNGTAVGTGSSIALRTEDPFTVVTSEQYIEAGDQVTVAIQPSRQASVEAYQWTLAYNTAHLAIDEVEGVQSNHPIVYRVDDQSGLLHISVVHSEGMLLNESEAFVTIQFNAVQEGMLSHLVSLSDKGLAPEIYFNDTDRGQVQLEFSEPIAAETILYQNRPNPFVGSTEVQFYLPKRTKATISVYNTAGKLIEQHQSNYAKGLHKMELDLTDKGAKGVLYYQLETPTYTATKKMIVLE